MPSKVIVVNLLSRSGRSLSTQEESGREGFDLHQVDIQDESLKDHLHSSLNLAFMRGYQNVESLL